MIKIFEKHGLQRRKAILVDDYLIYDFALIRENTGQ